jgi:hypothetical protein
MTGSFEFTPLIQLRKATTQVLLEENIRLADEDNL